MIFDGFSHQLPDIDPEVTKEWLDSFDAVVDAQGRGRGRFLLMKLLERARELQVGFPATVSTPYINTISPEHEPWFPGDEHMERRIRAFIRWNAAVMVTRANTLSEGIGGHLSTYASSASLYEVGFNHFFKGKEDGLPGDQVFFQGHAAPGIYARAYMEGRLVESQLDHYRREIGGQGVSSYPHPRLMPDFWEFPTVSMGLGPINAIYQARFNRYLQNRRIADTSQSKVWCFVGDGETDEPESLGALSVAAREQLDNLIFVVNCNLQRLDGPVRGNGKIIQELEAVFRGAGWNVIKVIWGSKWDELLARDVDGVLLNKMNTTVDGEFQKYAVETGAYIREHFFGPDPRLRKLVEHLSDEDLQALPRGGHDYRKLYAAYKAAVEHEGAPTVILAKTIKGWTLGPEIEARNATHQIKKMTKKQLQLLRDRLYLQDEIPDEALDADLPPYYRPAEGSPTYEYLMERRRRLDGPLPSRVVKHMRLPAPNDKAFDELLAGSSNQAVSTTMGFTRLLRNLLRDENVGARVVPIIPDEARTFGMDALFSEVKIYAPFGQRYEPVDAAMQLSYRESQQGQILEEGITEAGSMASFTAAGTAYATHATPMIPFYIFYSMFGFQRTGDLIWSFGDQRGRGFLLGATAGRTTLNGEGLQHEDGHSLVLASTVPNVCAYDPAFAYEVALIVRDGIKRMYTGEVPEDRFYYLTLYNENYPMPPMPQGAEEGVIRGLYKWADAPEGPSRRATILFSGSAYNAAVEARKLLAEKHDVAAELWSATSYKGLRQDALTIERWNRLHPTEAPRVPYVTEALSNADGPFVAVTDFMKSVPDQVARWVPGHFTPLGTDGYGRSDTRANLRRHFEVDAAHIAVATLKALADTGDGKAEEVVEAIRTYEIDADRPDPAGS
ncbi:MAG TPA: pyruvate dehydrogenase (acetyl-transferring), homodimeric type [Acidimicrobiales bacterium]|jgi:pyruvate dehydrogenase E1 component|nr:pyruvate dehydrogenase (acetyl-transferring), homodimeric type [Acidimicrobiales bacterium]